MQKYNAYAQSIVHSSNVQLLSAKNFIFVIYNIQGIQ